jgi:hypothetical protein
MLSSAQFRVAALIAGGVLSACGDDNGVPAGDASPLDGAPICGPLVCEALPAGCGTGTDGCGEPVDCGSCSFAIESVKAGAKGPAIAVGDVPTIAYALDDAGWGIHVARRTASGWVDEPVAALDGEPAGRADLAISVDGTRWVVFPDMDGQIWVAHGQPTKAWIVEGPLATGATVALAIGGDGEPVVALAGLVETTSGVFVARRTDGVWDLSPIGDPATSGAPRSLAVVAVGDEVAVVWRDPSDDGISYARGRNRAYSVESVDPGSPAPSHEGALSLAFGPLGRPHVVYGRGNGELVYAVRIGEIWDRVVIASNQADRDDALAIDLASGLHVAFFAADGLHVVDGLAGAWLGQLAADDCTDGDIDLALDTLGSVHVTYGCADAVRHLARSGPL